MEHICAPGWQTSPVFRFTNQPLRSLPTIFPCSSSRNTTARADFISSLNSFFIPNETTAFCPTAFGDETVTYNFAFPIRWLRNAPGTATIPSLKIFTLTTDCHCFRFRWKQTLLYEITWAVASMTESDLRVASETTSTTPLVNRDSAPRRPAHLSFRRRWGKAFGS
jgi:hypothetical protein